MTTPTLVILAAGMGSRYGGLKQIDTVGNNGESIIDFSIYDAIQAGFKKLVLIIKKEHEEAFEKSLVAKIRPFIEVHYAFQELDDIPEGYSVPEGREKPWGTVQALKPTQAILGTDPFMVINADDYYGKSSFVLMHQFLTSLVDKNHYSMVGYILRNTLTDHGHVTRAVCEKSEEGYLEKIVEYQKIAKKHDLVVYENNGIWEKVDGDSICSMNYWGFSHHIFDQLEPLFKEFLDNNLEKDPLKCEYVIPTAIGQLVDDNQIKVKIYSSEDQWFGVTYQEDKEQVVKKFQEFKDQGLYPQDLWSK